ncbi:MAG: glycine--tRNA ligase subunit beta [Deltaproteobacteria bacterium]|nr:glycine--tRNA ligase subunit beta [Deltaproteobacteria bacterium]
MPSDLLLEIGVEELPASFVASAVEALPRLFAQRLTELRLSHGALRAVGTPRRVALLASGVEDRQPDLEEEVVGPPSRVAFDAAGKPTRAAEAFAAKAGVESSALFVKATPKGDYVAAVRREAGATALSLLPALLERVSAEIPFRKSMRWAREEQAFGRPVRWIVALLGSEVLAVRFAGVDSGRTTYGHRFLGGGPLTLTSPSGYEAALRAAHVLVDPEERRRAMVERLEAEAARLGGTLIPDEFLVEENGSLVEEPQIVAGSFDPEFLALPERVILDVAKGHQRYFGVRAPDGSLMPRYLAVVNTAIAPENVRRGNDRVMRARLADAKFFFDEDRKTPLEGRRPALDRIVFHKRLGSVGDKVRRVERLVGELGTALGLPSAVVGTALKGAGLAKCDLVTLMVGELPELQGEMGRAYAEAQGVDPGVATVIAEHYLPRGADDAPASSDAGALAAVADRLDTLVGSCAVNVMPTGTADPLALRRAAIGLLRTLLARGWDLDVPRAVAAAHGGYDAATLDLDAATTADRMSAFLAQRLRGVLAADLPGDVIDACVAAGHARPLDVSRRARALAAIDPAVRASAGEVFKRAANIARDAPEGAPVSPSSLGGEVHASEQALWEGFVALEAELGASLTEPTRALASLAGFAPLLGRFFVDVFVMVDDVPVRENRLRLMREIHRTCSRLAAFNFLAKAEARG